MLDTVSALVKKVIRAAKRVYFRSKADSVVGRLESHADPRVRKIGLAIRQSLTGNLDDAERQAIARIEARRQSLLHSTARVSVTDYGAGSPTANRSQEEMSRGVMVERSVPEIASASKPPFWCTLLFKLAREFQPVSCLELGTCAGISASYQATALGMNGKGRLLTLEGCPTVAGIANETFGSLGITNASVVIGPFHQTFGDALEAARPVDFFFNDGHHDYTAVMDNFNRAAPCLARDALVIIDDINWSKGMRQAWDEITQDARVSVSIDLGSIGIVLLGAQQGERTAFHVPLRYES